MKKRRSRWFSADTWDSSRLIPGSIIIAAFFVLKITPLYPKKINAKSLSPNLREKSEFTTSFLRWVIYSHLAQYIEYILYINVVQNVSMRKCLKNGIIIGIIMPWILNIFIPAEGFRSPVFTDHFIGCFLDSENTNPRKIAIFKIRWIIQQYVTVLEKIFGLSLTTEEVVMPDAFKWKGGYRIIGYTKLRRLKK